MYFRICGYLDDIMDIFETGDTILLGEGNHSIKGSNGLQEGGTIIGLSNAENTIISPLEPDMLSSLFDLCGNEVCLDDEFSDVSATSAIDCDLFCKTDIVEECLYRLGSTSGRYNRQKRLYCTCNRLQNTGL